MSILPQSSENAFEAEAVDAQAAAWLERREFGPADQAALEAWLNQSWQHRVAYWRMKAVWDETNRFAALRPPATAQQRQGRASHVRTWRFLAAVLAVGIVCTALFFDRSKDQTFATVLGARKTLTLSDGSQIELNTNTSIRVAADQRTAWLEKGEAYFQITHDANHPFTVNVGDRRVIDLGTKFVIRHDSENTRVALIEGRAEVQSDTTGARARSVVLTPGDVAIASLGVLSVERKPNRELKDQLGWRHGLLIFYHTPLADAAREFNRYNRQKLIIADDDTARRRINGTFLANNAEVFGHVAQAVLGLHVEKQNDRIVISR